MKQRIASAAKPEARPTERKAACSTALMVQKLQPQLGGSTTHMKANMS
jgi:hypothetical protein